MKRFLIICGIVITTGASAAFWYNRAFRAIPEEFVSVARGSVAQTVSVTGKIKPASAVDLAFEQGGKIVNVGPDVGAHVEIGDILVSEDASVFLSELEGAIADRDRVRAHFDELKKGASPEEIKLAEIKVQSANTALEDAKKTLLNSLEDGYLRSNDAIRIQSDQLFSNPRSTNPVLNVYADFGTKSALENERTKLEQAFVSWKNDLDTVTPDSDTAHALSESHANMARVKNFLDTMVIVVNGLTQNSVLSQSTIDGYRSNILTARANLSAAVTALAASEEKVRTAASNVNVAGQELVVKKQGPTAEVMRQEEAKLHQAEASVSEIRAKLAKTKLVAPFAGVVTKQDAKEGAIAAANVPLVSLISDGRLEIEARVPEVDIGNIKAGNPVLITIDAFPGESFKGSVTRVDPAETIVDGVVNFNITVHFDRADPRLKSGLTANLVIETLQKNGVLVLPQFAIIEKDQGTFVRVGEGTAAKEVPVVTGIRSQNGTVEIVSGVAEGDRVVNIGLKKQ